MKRLFRYRWVLIVVPYILAFIGYYEAYSLRPDVHPEYILTSCLFESFKIYGMSVSVDMKELNVWLEVARWLGALVTTTIIVDVIKHVATQTRLRWRLRKPEIVVVHGDGVLKETILHSLGKSGLASGSDLCFNARNHVIAFDHDGDAIRYILEHEKDFFTGDKQVCFSSTDYEPSDYLQSGLTVSNTAVNCARLYWQKHWLRDDSIRKVAIVGFGHFGQRMLEQALLVNVLPGHSPIEYHIYGSDGKDFLAWRPQLKNCLAINQSDDEQDSLHFHSSLEEMGLDHIQGMDRIIFIQDDVDDSLLQLNYLLHAGLNGVIHIRCGSDILNRLQYLPERQMRQGLLQIIPFGEDDALFSQDVILHGKLTEAARAEHSFYVSQSSAQNIRKKYSSCTQYADCKGDGLCSACPHGPATWDDLTPFEKSSNIALADHLPVKTYLLEKMGRADAEGKFRQDLCRTEHIRWCRFYSLHNWQYAPIRDDSRRLHPALRPFEQLTTQEREKDWWAYKKLLNNHVKAGNNHE